MDTVRSTFSRAKKNRIDHGYAQLSYRQKYILTHLKFLYEFVKPRKSGPRSKAKKKSTANKAQSKAANADDSPPKKIEGSQEDDSINLPVGDQQSADDPNEVRTTEDNNNNTEPQDEVIYDHKDDGTSKGDFMNKDPITTESNVGISQVTSTVETNLGDDGPFDEDPMTKEIEEV